MRLKLIGLLVFIVLIYGCFSGNQPLSLSQIIKQASSGQAILLDVRTQEEYEKIRAKGALHLSLSDLQSGKMPNIGRKWLYIRRKYRWDWSLAKSWWTSGIRF